MKIQTFSIVCGTSACNARCPFCVSKMTVENGVGLKPAEVDWRNFSVAAKIARASGCVTAMITSKGEPTLFPGLVDDYVYECREHGFPLIELQTNGIPIWDNRAEWTDQSKTYAGHLDHWYNQGLTTVAISVVHHDPEINRKVYVPYRKKYIDLPGLISLLNEIGFSVRLAVVGIKGGIDDWASLKEMIDFARDNKVAQLTWRPVNVPAVVAQGDEIAKWQSENAVEPTGEWQIENNLHGGAGLKKAGTVLLKTRHGMVVYDVDGQNLALTNCLTQPVGEEIRQLIVFPDGRISYDWCFAGARIL